MNIFIFEPFEWDYCGGAVVVIARTFNGAKKIAQESELKGHEFFQTPNEAEVFKQNLRRQGKYRRWDMWVLTNVFKLAEGHKPSLVTINYNYA